MSRHVDQFGMDLAGQFFWSSLDSLIGALVAWVGEWGKSILLHLILILQHTSLDIFS